MRQHAYTIHTQRVGLVVKEGWGCKGEWHRHTANSERCAGLAHPLSGEWLSLTFAETIFVMMLSRESSAVQVCTPSKP